ncbi:spore germination protein [Shouchella sp. 1P09AA]|uniref:spore germination protein n=1 Tax=unclassified Shouchella TaxID=2893065 RepID=UPI0039A30E13
MFSHDFEKNKKLFLEAIGEQSDLHQKHVYLSGMKRFGSYYLLGEFDDEKLDRSINYMNSLQEEVVEERCMEEEVKMPVLCLAESTLQTTEEAVSILYLGRCVFFLDGIPFAYNLQMTQLIQRNLEESTTERVIRGPRASFLEDAQTNVSLIRQFGEDENLITAKHNITNQGKTKTVYYMYNKENTPSATIKEVQDRLKAINHANIEDSGKMESFLDNSPIFSPFPQIQSSDRIDRILAGFEEGRVAVLVNGSPFVFMVPTTFEQQMQAPDDYYERWMISSIIRILRYIALFITMFVSPIYIALVSFHQGLIPNELSMTIMNSRMNIPFPAVGEVILMTLFIELLREASIRLPNPLGQTIGLVGGVVIGQAVVEANLVSSIMVIVIAITAIASFAVPLYSLSMSFRILSVCSIALASTLGLYGVAIYFIAVTIHLSSLHNYGVHYFSFKFSLKRHGFYDLIIRLPTVLKDKRGA